jgi:hypothetical protein
LEKTMPTEREVTERDFRKEEYRDAVPQDYEFRDDGALVRKDRWETGIRRIARIVGLGDGDFEIDAVVANVLELAKRSNLPWHELALDFKDVPAPGTPVIVRWTHGAQEERVTPDDPWRNWTNAAMPGYLESGICAWRMQE